MSLGARRIRSLKRQSWCSGGRLITVQLSIREDPRS
jgi:hypothetical protein